jgi:glycosyltransferase involved in cell wall biosynthesis
MEKQRVRLPRVIAWGSYDTSKPRVRLLLAELRAQGVLQAEINIPVWNAIRDKAVAGVCTLLKSLLRLFASYPGALAKLARQPRHSVVLLPYPPIPDIFAAWAFARLRGHRIVIDAFISLYDTMVSDRQMLGPGGVRANVLWGIEWLALRLADVVLVDTDQNGDFFAREFGIERQRFQTVLVGADDTFWNVRTESRPLKAPPAIDKDLPTVLFYGQLIPLHGLDTILDAIRRTEAAPLQWLLIGSGQEEPALRAFLENEGSDKVTWLPWIEYDELPAVVAAAEVALGIFGTSDKAARVIPNKVFQALAAGTPLITRESPAVRELAERFPAAIRTVPPGDGAALAGAVWEAIDGKRQPVKSEARTELGPATGVQDLLAGSNGRGSIFEGYRK